jgi:hypothetical protein
MRQRGKVQEDVQTVLVDVTVGHEGAVGFGAAVSS